MSSSGSRPTDIPQRKRSYSFGWNPEFKPLVGVFGSPPSPAAGATARARSGSQSSAIDEQTVGSVGSSPASLRHNRSVSMSASLKNLNRVPTVDEERILKGEFLF